MIFLILVFVVVSVIAGAVVGMAGGGLRHPITQRRADLDGLTSAEFQVELWKLDHPEYDGGPPC